MSAYLVCCACGRQIDPSRLVHLETSPLHADCAVAVLQQALIEVRENYRQLCDHHGRVEHELVELRSKPRT